MNLKRFAAPLALLLALHLGFTTYADVSPATPPIARSIRLPEASQQNLISSYRLTVKVNGAPHSSGTGIAIDAHTVLSAGHMVEPGENVTYWLDIFTLDGFTTEAESIELKLVRYNDPDLAPALDLALFTSSEDIPHHHALIYARNARVGEWVYTVGARFGESPYLQAWGQLGSKTSRNYSGLWLASLNSGPGNSGGGVWNQRHEFMGILVRGRETIVLFVPYTTVRDFIEGVSVKK